MLISLQENAKQAAEEEQLRIKDMDREMIRLRHDRQTRAVVRHNAALEKELLSHVSNDVEREMVRL